MKSLIQAIKNQDIPNVKELLEKRPERKFNFDYEGEAKGLTPLHYLVGADIGHITAREILNLLLEQPTMVSLTEEQREVVKRDYQNYIDTTTRDGNANTALHIAAKTGNSNAVLALLRAGARSDIKNAQGKTAVELTNDESLKLWFQQYNNHNVRTPSSSQANIASPVSSSSSKTSSSSISVPAQRSVAAKTSSRVGSVSTSRSVTASASSSTTPAPALRPAAASASSSPASPFVSRFRPASASSSAVSPFVSRFESMSPSSSSTSVPARGPMLSQHSSLFSTRVSVERYVSSSSSASSVPPAVSASASSSSASVSIPQNAEISNSFSRKRAGTDYIYFINPKVFARLKDAAMNGETELVKQYIQKDKHDINHDYSCGDKGVKSLLRFAAEVRNLEMVTLLLSLGAIVYQSDIDATDQKDIKDLLQEHFDKTTPLQRFIAKYVGLHVYNNAFNENMIRDFRDPRRQGGSLLHLIITDNHFPREEVEPILRKLLEKYKIDINTRNNDGDTPLLSLVKTTKLDKCEKERNKRIEWLMNLDADINAVNNDSETPIFSAVKNAKSSLIIKLHKLGANIQHKNKNGQSLIDLANSSKITKEAMNYLNKNINKATIVPSSETYPGVGNSHFFGSTTGNPLPKGLQRVFRRTNEEQRKELWTAVNDGDTVKTRDLIERKQYDVNCIYEDDVTFLLMAIKANNDDMVTMLLELGALVYQDDLAFAQDSKLSLEVIEKLSKAYDILDKQDPVDEFIVREMGLNFYEFIKVRCVELRKSVIGDFRGEKRNSLLNIAASRGLVDYLAPLVNIYGMDVNLKSGMRMKTPLHIAVVAENNAKELVETLLKLKANVNIKDDNGNTPKDYARAAGKTEVLALLESPPAPEAGPQRKRLRKAT